MDNELNEEVNEVNKVRESSVFSCARCGTKYDSKEMAEKCYDNHGLYTMEVCEEKFLVNKKYPTEFRVKFLDGESESISWHTYKRI